MFRPQAQAETHSKAQGPPRTSSPKREVCCNFATAYFFLFLAVLNEIVWRTQPETTWVNFKVWGILPITIIFTAFQLSVITKFKLNE